MNVSQHTLNPFVVIACWRESIRLLKKSTLRKFIIWPIVVNLVLYTVAFGLSYHYVTHWIDQLLPASFIGLNWILSLIVLIGFFALVFFSFTLVANLLLAPFYGILAEQALRLITGQSVTTHNIPVLKIVWSEAKRLCHFAGLSLPLVMLSFIPVINLIVPFLGLIVGAWILALEYMAYPLENEGILFAEQKQRIQKIRLHALYFGNLIMLGLTIPLVNIVIGPVAVIAAAVYWHRLTPEGSLSITSNSD